jgi:four helix bundle protein
MAFYFEKLEAYQKAIQIAEDLSALTDRFTRHHYYLIEQINQTALGIAANLVEGNGRYKFWQKKYFLDQAEHSALACIPLLEICRRKNLITAAEHFQNIESLTMFCRLLERFRQTFPGGSNRDEK